MNAPTDLETLRAECEDAQREGALIEELSFDRATYYRYRRVSNGYPRKTRKALRAHFDCVIRVRNMNSRQQAQTSRAIRLTKLDA